MWRIDCSRQPILFKDHEWPENPTMLQAAEDSLAKWQAVFNYSEQSKQGDPMPSCTSGSCLLCECYYNEPFCPHDPDNMYDDDEEDADICQECPLAKMTGASGCLNTPYSRWVDSSYAWSANCDLEDAKAAADDFCTLLSELVDKIKKGEIT